MKQVYFAQRSTIVYIFTVSKEIKRAKERAAINRYCISLSAEREAFYSFHINRLLKIMK